MHSALARWTLWALAAASLLAAWACSPARESPLISSEEFGAPTPIPTPTATALPEASVDVQGRRSSDAQTALDVVGKDVITIANWRDASLAMHNNLVGYLMVWGYGYTVELVDIPPEDYPDAIARGELDVVMQVDLSDEMTGAWFAAAVESGDVLDAGGAFSDQPDLRIGARHSLRERAPDLLELLADVDLGGEAFLKIAGSVRFGRVGVTPSAGSLKYLKEQRAVWRTWVSEEAAAGVDAAIAASKTSLRNRTCIPEGVEANDCGRN